MTVEEPKTTDAAVEDGITAGSLADPTPSGDAPREASDDTAPAAPEASAVEAATETVEDARSTGESDAELAATDIAPADEAEPAADRAAEFDPAVDERATAAPAEVEPAAPAEPDAVLENATFAAAEPLAEDEPIAAADVLAADEPVAAAEVVVTDASAVADSPAVAEAEAAPAEEAAPTAVEPPPPPIDDRPEPTTMEELLNEQAGDIRSLKHGDVVEGTVVRIDKDEMLVDIGAKSEGVVSNRELYGRNTETQPELNIGDTVLVYVLQPESQEGHAVLSLRRAGLERKWRGMQEQFDEGVIIEAPVIDHNKGGLIVDCGIRGFVPISQIVDFPRRPQNDQPRDAAQEIAEKLMPFVGRKLRLKILEVNRKANRLILSEKVALYEERREKRDELFSSLQVGQKVTGSVRSIAPFGVFVDLGGIDGLVHKSELSWNKVNNPEGGYRVGEEVEAEVIDINHERGRISLSIRRLQPDPWHSTVADFNVGDIIDGTVTKLVNFGAFVRVRDGLEGLIHISELSNQRVAHPGDVVHEGQALKLRIISLDSERHRLGLSLKQAEEAAPRPPAEDGAAATAPQPRPERGERPERGDRRPRGGDRERTRSYTAADAVQEPEGGIDTTLAAAFAGVREQLARAEAGEDGTEAATAEAPGVDEAEHAGTELDGSAEPTSEAEAPEAAAEAVTETPAEPEAVPETVAEAPVEPEAAPEAVAEPEPEPAEAKPAKAVAEPAAEPEPAEAKPAKAVKPAAEPDMAPEVVAEPEAAPVEAAPAAGADAEAAPEPEAEASPEPEAESPPEPEAEAQAEPEPEAQAEEPKATAKAAKGAPAADEPATTPESEEKAVS